MDASVIIPVYNERHRLPAFLTTVRHYLASQFSESEIIVVEDGSEIPVGEYVRSLVDDDRVHIRYLAYEVNRGKGYAVKQGVLASTGDLVAFMDADGATPVTEFDRLLAVVRQGADVAIGSRALPSTDTTVDKTIHRFVIGRSFTLIMRVATGLRFLDTQCGFKLFTKKAGHDIFAELATEGFAFDVEVLHRAAKKGYVVKEIPVNWSDVAGSKVRLATDSFRMLRDVIRISLLK